MNRKSQNYYSWIAYNYCNKNNINIITYGNFDLMCGLFELFGGDRDKLIGKDFGARKQCCKEFQSVMNKLDREYKQTGTILEKFYIRSNGTTNYPTRAYRFIRAKVERYKKATENNIE